MEDQVIYETKKIESKAQQIDERSTEMINVIIKAVHGVTGVTFDEIKSGSHLHRIAIARQMLQTFIKKYTILNYVNIAIASGKRNHSSAMFSVRKVNDFINLKYPEYVNMYQAIDTRINDILRSHEYALQEIVSNQLKCKYRSINLFNQN